MFEALKDKNRLSADLDAANQSIAALNQEIAAKTQEIAKLRDAVQARSECIKELCACLDEATPWLDPIMIGPLTLKGDEARTRLLERVDAALTWAGHRQAPREESLLQRRRAG